MTAKGAVLSEEEKAKARARAAAYYHARKNDPAFKAKKAACTSAWAQANPDKTKAWRTLNREELSAYYKKYFKYAENYAKHKSVIAARQRKHRALINSLKTGPCLDCGKQYPPYVMDFDHRPGSGKHLNVSKMTLGYPLAKIMAEIAKCDLVCANCHRERTHSRLTKSQVT